MPLRIAPLITVTEDSSFALDALRDMSRRNVFDFHNGNYNQNTHRATLTLAVLLRYVRLLSASWLGSACGTDVQTHTALLLLTHASSLLEWLKPAKLNGRAKRLCFNYNKKLYSKNY